MKIAFFSVFIFLVGCMIGIIGGIIITAEKYQNEAVERNYAEYDIKSGIWHWKDNQ